MRWPAFGHTHHSYFRTAPESNARLDVRPVRGMDTAMTPRGGRQLPVSQLTIPRTRSGRWQDSNPRSPQPTSNPGN
jgi:hypothetical protein